MKLQQIDKISKLYTKIHNLNEIPYKYLLNTLLKLKNHFALHFLELLNKKSVNMQQQKKEFTTKHCMFGAKKLRQPRKFYTTAGCDG